MEVESHPVIASRRRSNPAAHRLNRYRGTEICVSVPSATPMEVDKRPAFDPDSFFRKALEIAETTEAH